MSGKVDIDKLALLARIKLTEKEKEKFQKEFEAILDYVSQLEKAETGKISDKDIILETGAKNITREDENPLKPAVGGDYVKVKHILK
jgi:aspartyl-tRNA(Asn)/glutamyl-tRNA(Gln) amidotransferase subunit C